MNKSAIIISIILILTAIVLTLLWVGGSFNGAPDGNPIATPTDPISTSTPSEVIPTPPINEIPPLPLDFDKFIDNNLNMSSDMKIAFKEKFNGLVTKIRKDASYSPDWIDLGAVKHAVNDYKGAESAWLFATKIDPEATGAYSNLGQLYWHKLPDIKKAEEMFLKNIELGENDLSVVRIYRDLSDLYRYDYKEKAGLADDILIEGLKAYPDDLGLMAHLARYYYDIGEKEKAIEYYEKILKINPADSSATEYLLELRGKK